MKEFKKLVIVTLIFLVTITMLSHVKAEAQTNSTIEDPTPSYMNLSEYMIGSCTASIILPESNGSIDPSTEDWTNEEIDGVLNMTQRALDWWAAQNNGTVRFVTDVHTRLPTSYEPMDRPSTEIKLWACEVMADLGYNGTPNDYVNITRRYLNDLREKLQTDWAFMIFILDASNSDNEEFIDGRRAHAWMGGPYIAIPIRTIDYLDYKVAHEMGHIFYATDEYNNIKEQCSGYLNVTEIDDSCDLMCCFNSWTISGKPYGLNGTWGQIGWRDSDSDGIQDIVDTPQQISLSSSYDMTIRTLECTGRAAVIPTINNNFRSWQRNNITINKIQSVQYRIDSGEWLNATMIPTLLRKEIRNTGDFYFKNTTAIVNFTFTQQLSFGIHVIEVKAINQWGNSGYANDTVVAGSIHDVAITNITLGNKTILARGSSTSINVSAANLGSYTETFNVSIYANATWIMSVSEAVSVFWSATFTFIWNTTGFDYGSYIICAYATPVANETDTSNNNCTVGMIKVTIQGDINGDFKVGLLDLVNLALSYGSKPDDPNWNSNADIDGNDIVNLGDLVYLAWNYGKQV